MINYITASNDKWTGNNNESIINRDIACTINTAPGQRRCDASNYVADGLPKNTDLKKYSQSSLERIQKNIINGELAPTITANAMQSINHQNCGLVKETVGGVMIKENNSKGYKVAKVGDGVNLASRMKHQRGNVQKGMIQTLKTEMEIGIVVDDEKD